jgi:hypothetical protein
LRTWQRLLGPLGLLRRGALPEGFTGDLEGTERVLGSAAVADGGHVVVTSHGLWVPEGESHRRIGWHLVSNARWDGRALAVTEADEAGLAGTTVLLVDRPQRRFALREPGTVPQLVHSRVTRSVLSSERRDVAGGSAVVVRRRVPGRDGVQVQVRPDPGTDLEAVRRALESE